MKIESPRKQTTAAGMQAERQFFIKSGPHMMAILSGLYSNPIEAMVREYLTNMYDGWLALQRQQPGAVYQAAELHLPSSLTPQLVFKDYGIGMSYDMVWNTYAGYGASTKQDSNDEVGGWGLGAKTAFCYNNGQQWTVESRFNGEKMLFTAWLDETGMPKLAHVMTTPTDERNGVTVTIPIRREDVAAVRQAAEKLVPFYPLKLEVLNTDKAISPPSYKLEGSLNGMRWGFDIGYTAPARSYHHWRQPAITLVMGNVPYPLEGRSFPAAFYFTGVLDIYVPIGAVDITPSRDSVKWTDKTTQFVESVLNNIVNKEYLSKILTDRIKTAKNLWEASQLLSSFVNIFPNTFSDFKVKWNGKPVNQYHLPSLEDMQAADPRLTLKSYWVDGGDYGRLKEGDTPVVVNNPELYRVLIDDGVKNAGALAKGWCREKLVVRGTSGRPVKYGHRKGAVTVVTTKLSHQQLADAMGGIPLEMISNASSLVNIVKPAKDEVEAGLYKSRNGRPRWDARTRLPKGSGPFYYVPLKKQASGRYGSEYDQREREFGTILQFAGMLGLNTSDIYGIREENVNSFDDTKWVSLVDTLKARFPAYCEEKALAIGYYLVEDDTNYRPYINRFAQLFKIVRPNEWRQYESMQEIGHKASSYFIIARALGVEVPHTPAVVGAKHARQALVNDFVKYLNKYPMLKAFEDATHYGRVKPENMKNYIQQYIALVDQSAP